MLKVEKSGEVMVKKENVERQGKSEESTKGKVEKIW